MTTSHNDNLRTGDNLNETTLTPSAVGGGTFRQLCVASQLDAPIYSQPLVFSNISVLGHAYTSVVYVSTLNGTLYAINGTPQGNTCQVIGSVSLLPANQYPADCYYLGGGAGNSCVNTIYPSVGILGTPAIGKWPSSPTPEFALYAVTETQSCPGQCGPSTFYHYLHAVDIQGLKEITTPIRIYPPSFNSTQASQWSFQHIQRPGLLLTPDDYLYIGFSMMDGNAPLPNGSVFGYNLGNFTSYNQSLQPLYFPVTPDAPNSAGGGVWQDGGGLAYGPDDNGTNAIYFNTGNGLYDGSSNFADSFLKLNPSSLSLSASFTPGDQAWRNCAEPNYTDADFGSGAPMLTPSTSQWPYIAVSAEKEGYVWVMDRLAPGGYSTNNSQCPTLQACTKTNDCTLAQQNNQNKGTLSTGGPYANVYFQDTPAYWFSNDGNNDEYIFLASSKAGNVNGVLYRYQLYPPSYNCVSPYNPPLCNQAGVPATAQGVNVSFSFGATVSISATSTSATDAVVWAIDKADGFRAESTTPGVFYAFDAPTMQQLYASSNCASDGIAPATKFSVPTVANGYVYVGTAWLDSMNTPSQGALYIFGLGHTC